MSAHKQRKYLTKNIVAAIKLYTDNTAMPILKECCLLNDWNYDYIMALQRENAIIAQAIRRLLAKKEVFLEKMLVGGKHASGCIFALKQLGWKDNPQQIVVNGGIETILGGNRSAALNKLDSETLETLERIYAEVDNAV